MKKSELKQIIKEEIIKEIKVSQPSSHRFEYCWIDSHSDYKTLNLASKKSFEEYIKELADDNETNIDDVLTWEFNDYVKEIPKNKIIFISWNDEGPYVTGYEDLYEFLQEITTGYWGEDQIIEKLDQMGYDGERGFNKWYEDGDENIQKEIFNIIKQWIDNSEADGDSNSATCLIINGKIVAGEDNTYNI
jgi:hypothetical protein